MTFYEAFNEEMNKLSGRTEAAIVGAPFGPLAGLAAEKGKGWRTAAGGALGSIGGSIAGSIAGAPLGGGRHGAAIRRALQYGGIMGGGAGGAYYAHGPNKGKKKKKGKK